MDDRGYFRHPTVQGDRIAFVCEDDIWSASMDEGLARRLTVGQGDCTMPRFSPDGKYIAFVGREEGHAEVYVIPSDGGLARRVTYLSGDTCLVCGWSADGSEIFFVSDAGAAFAKHTEVFAVSPEGGTPRALNLGLVRTFSQTKSGVTAIGRNSVDPAMWKRYRGGTAGEIWVDAAGKGKYRRILEQPGNHVWPMLIGQRIYFLSDFEGVGNLYSCKHDGSDIKRHTKHNDYFVRYPSTDGRRIIYTAGADIYIYDTKTETASRIEIDCPSTTTQSARRFVPTRDYLEHVSLSPNGHSLALISRGQPFTMPFWEEAAVQHGSGSRVRYRMSEWLSDGNRFVVINDQAGYERLEVHHADQSKDPVVASSSDLGRVIQLVAAPDADLVALANHKHELVVVDLKTKKSRILDRSPADRITGLNWSPDGRWLAYVWSALYGMSKIRIVEVKTGAIHDVTDELRYDWQPCFDPDGNYLYFLSARDFHPVYDHVQFDLSFVESVRPFLVTLRKDVPSPFVLKPKPLVKLDRPAAGQTAETAERQASGKAAKQVKAEKVGRLKAAEGKKGAEKKTVEIDFDGIAGRVLGFPVEPGRYGQVVAARGRVLFTLFPVKGIRPGVTWWNESEPMACLMAYDFEENRAGQFQREVGSIALASDYRTLVYTSRDKWLRVIDALEKLPESGPAAVPAGRPSRKTGWIDLSRVKAMIEPRAEWSQMFDEAWRLQREQFWDERMSDVDWDLVRKRYSCLLPRVRTRGELSDLIWEMQGELGTSHAYEMLGDYRRSPQYYRGFLGADLVFDKSKGGFRIAKILRGDSWERDVDSPLAEPGLGIEPGDVIVAVDGHKVSRQCSVEELLIHRAGQEIVLTLKTKKSERRRVVVRTLRDERALRYRAWVESNRKYVHERSKGLVGYVHIPDMGPAGFAEFHRGYLSEFNRQGLVVDVRYNRGGHVSPLLLEKLSRKRVGYDVSRWGLPLPYPPESVAGPLVALTNQFAGSDGDIFSHCFKLYKLGPLVGKRTWGGVIGIWPRHQLVDGTITTQPEFSFWFADVGWSVENYGTDPDYEVDISPQDYRSGKDPQLERALDLALDSLAKTPVDLPDFKHRPSLKIPTLAKGKK